MVRVTVPSLAKLNLNLRVLHKRADGYHELRTIFQTVSLGDRLTIEFEIAKRTRIELASSVEIPENLVLRAADLILNHLKVRAWVRFSLEKKIPMGAGMGGGSSNAAAVLAALPALAKRTLPLAELSGLGESLGSDVPFFLHGGTALGFGRGTELYPIPDVKAKHVLVVAPGVHVSTAEAYRALEKETAGPLTYGADSPILREFQSDVWSLSGRPLEQIPLINDFEEAVFKLHPELAKIVRKLKINGAKPALMTGSGSAIWASFPDAAMARRAQDSFGAERVFAVRFVGRNEYRALWRRALGPAAGTSCFV